MDTFKVDQGETKITGTFGKREEGHDGRCRTFLFFGTITGPTRLAASAVIIESRLSPIRPSIIVCPLPFQAGKN